MLLLAVAGCAESLEPGDGVETRQSSLTQTGAERMTAPLVEHVSQGSLVALPDRLERDGVAARVRPSDARLDVASGEERALHTDDGQVIRPSPMPRASAGEPILRSTPEEPHPFLPIGHELMGFIEGDGVTSAWGRAEDDSHWLIPGAGPTDLIPGENRSRVGALSLLDVPFHLQGTERFEDALSAVFIGERGGTEDRIEVVVEAGSTRWSVGGAEVLRHGMERGVRMPVARRVLSQRALAEFAEPFEGASLHAPDAGLLVGVYHDGGQDRHHLRPDGLGFVHERRDPLPRLETEGYLVLSEVLAVEAATEIVALGNAQEEAGVLVSREGFLIQSPSLDALSAQLRIEAPAAWDGAGARIGGREGAPASEDIHYVLRAREDGTHVLETHVPMAWASAAERALPLSFDPTITVIYAEEPIEAPGAIEVRDAPMADHYRTSRGQYVLHSSLLGAIPRGSVISSIALINNHQSAALPIYDNSCFGCGNLLRRNAFVGVENLPATATTQAPTLQAPGTVIWEGVWGAVNNVSSGGGPVPAPTLNLPNLTFAGAFATTNPVVAFPPDIVGTVTGFDASARFSWGDGTTWASDLAILMYRNGGARAQMGGTSTFGGFPLVAGTGFWTSCSPAGCNSTSAPRDQVGGHNLAAAYHHPINELSFRAGVGWSGAIDVDWFNIALTPRGSFFRAGTAGRTAVGLVGQFRGTEANVALDTRAYQNRDAGGAADLVYTGGSLRVTLGHEDGSWGGDLNGHYRYVHRPCPFNVNCGGTAVTDAMGTLGTGSALAVTNRYAVPIIGFNPPADRNEDWFVADSVPWRYALLGSSRWALTGFYELVGEERAWPDSLDEVNQHLWSFNGNTQDVSGSGRHANAVAAGRFVSGAKGQGVSFTSNQPITVPGTTPGANNFTMAAWVRPTATTPLPAVESNSGNPTGLATASAGSRHVIGPPQRGVNAGAGFSVGTNGVVVWEHGDAYYPAPLVFPTAIPSTGWTHVAVVYENRTPRLYINGVQVRTGLQSTRPTVYHGLQNGGQIGGGSYGHFLGDLDEVYVNGRALNTDEINRVMEGRHAFHFVSARTFVPTDDGTVHLGAGCAHNQARAGYRWRVLDEDLRILRDFSDTQDSPGFFDFFGEPERSCLRYISSVPVSAGKRYYAYLEREGRQDISDLGRLEIILQELESPGAGTATSSSSATSASPTSVSILRGRALVNGLSGSYYHLRRDALNNPILPAQFGERILTRLDEVVDFNWVEGAPAAGVPADYFAARWEGYLMAPVAGWYEFQVASDDGIRLILNGQQLTSDATSWVLRGETADNVGPVFLEPGLHPLRLEYFEYTGGASARLRWRPPGETIFRTIPADNLVAYELDYTQTVTRVDDSQSDVFTSVPDYYVQYDSLTPNACYLTRADFSYPTAPMPIVRYLFDGSLRDSSMRMLDLTGSGGTLGPDGLSLSGNASYSTRVTSSMLARDHTYRFRMRFDGVNASWTRIFGIDGEPRRTPSVFQHPNGMGLHWRYNPLNTGTDSYGPFVQGQFYEFVGVRYGNRFNLYVDGNLVASVTVSDNMDLSPGRLVLGAEVGVYGAARVTFRDFAFYDRALDPSTFTSPAATSGVSIEPAFSDGASLASAPQASHYDAPSLDGSDRLTMRFPGASSFLPFFGASGGAQQCGSGSTLTQVLVRARHCNHSDLTRRNATGLAALGAYWPLDGSGADLSGAGRNLGSIAAGRFEQGVYGEAVRFTGVGEPEWLTTPHVPLGSRNFSMAFWVRPDRTTPLPDRESNAAIATYNGEIMGDFGRWSNLALRAAATHLWSNHVIYPQHGGSLHAGAGVAVGTNGIVLFDHGADLYTAPLVVPMRVDDWTHVVVVYNDNRPSLYVNGQHVRTGLRTIRADVYSGLGTVHSESGARTGIIGGGSYGFFSGLIDDVRGYNRALTDSEIAALANANDHDDSLWQSVRSTTTLSGSDALMTMNQGSFGVGPGCYDVQTLYRNRRGVYTAQHVNPNLWVGPTAPTVTVTPPVGTTDRVTLAWTTVNGASGYQRRAVGAGTWATEAQSTLSRVITGLTENSCRNYEVRGTHAGTFGDIGVGAGATRVRVPQSSHVTDVERTAGGALVTLSPQANLPGLGVAGTCAGMSNQTAVLVDMRACGTGGFTTVTRTSTASNVVAVPVNAGCVEVRLRYRNRLGLIEVGPIDEWILEVPPAVATLNVTNRTATSAQFNGQVTQVGFPTAHEHGFCWRAGDANPVLGVDDCVTFGEPTAGVTFTHTPTLVEGQQYSVRAFVRHTRSDGTTITVYGDPRRVFSTLGRHSVETLAAVNVDDTRATVRGRITNIGDPAAATSFGFCVSTQAGVEPDALNGNCFRADRSTVLTGTIPALEAENPPTFVAQMNDTLSVRMLGLTPDTSYRFRAWVENSAGRAWGDTLVFDTLYRTELGNWPWDGGTSTTSGSARYGLDYGDLRGWVANPGSPSAHTYGVCWRLHSLGTFGDENAPGVSCLTMAGPLNAGDQYTIAAAGLDPDTRYFWRVFADQDVLGRTWSGNFQRTPSAQTAVNSSFWTRRLPVIETGDVLLTASGDLEREGEYTALGRPLRLQESLLCMDTNSDFSDETCVDFGTRDTLGVFADTIAAADLAPGTTYHVRACGQNLARIGSSSGVFTTVCGDPVTVTTPPTAPTDVVATQGTFDNRVVVSWTASQGATSYEVYRVEPGGGETLLCSGSAALACTDNGAPRGLLPTDVSGLDLSASNDRTTDVRIAFNALTPLDGASRTYRVRARGPAAQFSAFGNDATGWTGPSPIEYRLEIDTPITSSFFHNLPAGTTVYDWANAPRGSVSIDGLTATKGEPAHPDHVLATAFALATMPGAPVSVRLEARNSFTSWSERGTALGERAVGTPEVRFDRWRAVAGSPGTFTRFAVLRPFSTVLTLEDTSSDLDGGAVQWYGARVRAAGAIAEVDSELDYGYLFRPPTTPPVVAFDLAETTVSVAGWYWSGVAVQGALEFEQRSWQTHGGSAPATWTALSGTTTGSFFSPAADPNMCWTAEARARNLSGAGPTGTAQGATRLASPAPADFSLANVGGAIRVEADVTGVQGRGDGESCDGGANQTALRARAFTCAAWDAATPPAVPPTVGSAQQVLSADASAELVFGVPAPGCYRVQVQYRNRLNVPTQWVLLPDPVWTAPTVAPDLQVEAPTHARAIWDWTSVPGATGYQFHLISNNWVAGSATVDVEDEIDGAMAAGWWDALPSDGNPFSNYSGQVYDQREPRIIENVCVEAAVRAVNDGGAGPAASARIAVPVRAPTAPRHPEAVVGEALQMSASGGAAEIPWDNSLNTYVGTIELWIRPTTWTTDHVALLSRRTGTGDGFMVFRLAGSSNLMVDWGGNSTRWNTGVELPPLNRWTHLAFAHDGTTMRVFVNGEERASQVMGNQAAFESAATSLWLGRDSMDDRFHFEGQMKDIRLWSFPRTEEQIRGSLATLPSGALPGLVSAWTAHEPDLSAGAYTGQLAALREGFQQTSDPATRAAILADYEVLNESMARLADVTGRNDGQIALRTTSESLASRWAWSRESMIGLVQDDELNPTFLLQNPPANFGSARTCVGAVNETAIQFRLDPCEQGQRFPAVTVDPIETGWLSNSGAFPLQVEVDGHHCFDVRYRARNLDGVETAWSEAMRWVGFDLEPPAEYAQSGATVNEIFWQFRDASRSEDGWQLKATPNDSASPVCLVVSDTTGERGQLYRCDESIGTGAAVFHGNIMRERVVRSVIGGPFAANPLYRGSWSQPAIGYTLVRSPNICGQAQEDVDCGRVADSVWNGAEDFALTEITCDENMDNCRVEARLRTPRNAPYTDRTGAEIVRQEVLANGTLGPRVQVTSNQCITSFCENERSVVSHEMRGYGNWVANSDPRYWWQAGNSEGAIVDQGVQYGSVYRYAIRYFNANGFPSYTTTFDVLIGCEEFAGNGVGVCAFALPGTQPAAGTTVTRVAGCDIPGDGNERCDETDWSCSGDPYTEFDGTVAFTPGAVCGPCGDGVYVCLPDGSGQECVGFSLPNECGGCTPLAGSVGDPCDEPEGCGGELTCGPDNESLVCGNPTGDLNACGVNCLPLPAAPGDPCGDCGLWTCDGDGGLFCQEDTDVGGFCIVQGITGVCAEGRLICEDGVVSCESICEDGCSEDRAVATQITEFASGGIGDVSVQNGAAFGFATTIEELNSPTYSPLFDFDDDCDLSDGRSPQCSVVRFDFTNTGDDPIPAGTLVSIERQVTVPSSQRGVRTEYFNGPELNEFVSDVVGGESIEFPWNLPPSIPGLNAADYSIRYRGMIRNTNPAGGEIIFKVPNFQPALLIVNGVLILDSWTNPVPPNSEARYVVSGTQDMTFQLIVRRIDSNWGTRRLDISGGTVELRPYAARMESQRIAITEDVPPGGSFAGPNLDFAGPSLCWRNRGANYGSSLRLVAEDSFADLLGGLVCLSTANPASLANAAIRSNLHLALCGTERCDAFDNMMDGNVDPWPAACGDVSLECLRVQTDLCGSSNNYACATAGAQCNPYRGHCMVCAGVVTEEDDCNLHGCEGDARCDVATGICVPAGAAAADEGAAAGEAEGAPEPVGAGAVEAVRMGSPQPAAESVAGGGCAAAGRTGAAGGLLLLLALVGFVRLRPRRRRE